MGDLKHINYSDLLNLKIPQVGNPGIISGGKMIKVWSTAINFLLSADALALIDKVAV